MTIEAPQIQKPAWAASFQPAVSLGKPKSIFLYGTHGTRKTSISSSIAKVPGYERVLHIDVDNGTEVLANDSEIVKRVNDGTYNILPINPLETGAKSKIDSILNDITTVDYGYDAVIFDTFDVAQDVAEKVFKAINKDSKNTFATFGDLGVWSDETMRKLHDCKFFTAVVTAHENTVTHDDGTVKVVPRLSGSSKEEIGGIPSISAYLKWQSHPDTGEKHLVWNLGENEKMVVKNRFMLPNQILDADMPALFNLIEKSRANQKSTAPAAATK